VAALLAAACPSAAAAGSAGLAAPAAAAAVLLLLQVLHSQGTRDERCWWCVPQHQQKLHLHTLQQLLLVQPCPASL
jgi:hypothetical protein